MTTPRVAIVYPIPFGERGVYGGGERYALQLARTLAPLTPTRLVLYGSDPGRRYEGELRIDVHRQNRLLSREYGNAIGLGFLRSLRDVDVIHCLTWQTWMADLSVIAGRMTGKRVFLTDMGFRSRWSVAHRWSLGTKIGRFLGLSQFSVDLLGAECPRASVIYGGAEVVPAVRRDGPTRALFVGRFVEDKGIDVLIRALPAHVPLTVVGRAYNADYYRYLQATAEGKDVTFITDADDDRLNDEYRRATLFIQPAVDTPTDISELFGLVVAEAMMHGLPTIVSTCGSLPELPVPGETGVVVPQRDEPALRQAIEALAADPELARRMGEAGRARALAEFTWDRVAERCLQHYVGRHAKDPVEGDGDPPLDREVPREYAD